MYNRFYDWAKKSPLRLKTLKLLTKIVGRYHGVASCKSVDAIVIPFTIRSAGPAAGLAA